MILPKDHWRELCAHASTIKVQKFRDKLSGEKAVLHVVDLRKPGELPVELQEYLAENESRISSEAWRSNTGRPVPGYSDSYVKKHFLGVDRQFLVWDPKAKEIVGFAGIKKISSPEGLAVHMVEVSMISPKYQNMRLSTTLVSRLLIDQFIANGLQPMTIATRTANPLVMGALLTLEGIYPNPFALGIPPTAEQRKAFDLASGFLNPGQRADRETFVIDGVYPAGTGLLIAPHRIPTYSRDTRVNVLFNNLLEYDKFNRPEFFDGELAGVEMTATLSKLEQLVPRGEAGITEYLNNLITRNDLGAVLSGEMERVDLRPYTEQLLKFTASERAKSGDEVPSPDMIEAIKYCNRLLLEDIFAALPKRSAKALIITAIVTRKARKNFHSRETRLKLVSTIAAWIRKHFIR